MSETIGHGVNPRMDRIEAQLEVMVRLQCEIRADREKLVLTPVAHSTQGDEIERLLAQTDLRFRDLAVAEKHMDDALKALLRTVDLFIRSKN